MPIAALQTLTPHLGGASALIAAVAMIRRRPTLAAGSAAVFVGASTLTTPLLIRRSPGTGVLGDGLTIATVNLLYTNVWTEAIADDLLARDIDVITFTEYTAAHQRVLLTHDLVSRYPHRVDRPGPRALGVAVWSRVRLEQCTPAATVNHSIDVRICAPDHTFRLLALHTPTPFDDLGGWSKDLDVIRAAGTACPEPMVMIGDFNATCWHPAIRSILADGYRDALVAAGRPFAASWPVGSVVPPFAQLDHALVGPGLMVTGASNVPTPGSDHRGLIVSVAPAR